MSWGLSKETSIAVKKPVEVDLDFINGHVSALSSVDLPNDLVSQKRNAPEAVLSFLPNIYPKL